MGTNGTTAVGIDGGPVEYGDCIIIDTSVMDDGAARVRRAEETLVDAADGLETLPVAGVAVGGDAVLDALCDLGRQWGAVLRGTQDACHDVARQLRTAATEYASVEHEAALSAVDVPFEVVLDNLLLDIELPATPADGGDDR